VPDLATNLSVLAASSRYLADVSNTWAVIFKSCLKNWDTIVKNLGIIIAAVWALFQYNEHLQEGRVAAVLDYQRQLRVDPLHGAWKSVTISNIKESEAQQQALHAGGDRWIDYSVALGRADRDNLAEILSVYDGLYTCVEERLCDKNAAVRLFGYDAMNIYSYYGAYIECEKLRYIDNNYAQGLMFLRREFVMTTRRREPRILTLKDTDCHRSERS
jgi:hypothetical protein